MLIKPIERKESKRKEDKRKAKKEEEEKEKEEEEMRKSANAFKHNNQTRMYEPNGGDKIHVESATSSNLLYHIVLQSGVWVENKR